MNGSTPAFYWAGIFFTLQRRMLTRKAVPAWGMTAFPIAFSLGVFVLPRRWYGSSLLIRRGFAGKGRGISGTSTSRVVAGLPGPCKWQPLFDTGRIWLA